MVLSDFTEEEVDLMTKAGATPVGLGPCRLRVETATVALLATQCFGQMLRNWIHKSSGKHRSF